MNILVNQYLKYCLDPPKLTSWALEMAGVGMWCAPLALAAVLDCLFLAARAIFGEKDSLILEVPWSIYIGVPIIAVDISPILLPILFLWGLHECYKAIRK
jgi:hypothetical protein